MQLPIHPEALTELDHAMAWHERERLRYGLLLLDEMLTVIEVAHTSREPGTGKRADARVAARRFEQLRPCRTLSSQSRPSGACSVHVSVSTGSTLIRACSASSRMLTTARQERAT